MNRVIAADIGGTKSLLALIERGADGGYSVVASHRFASAEYQSLRPMIESFRTRHGDQCAGVSRLAIGVAGPVSRGGNGASAPITNLDWGVSEAEIVGRCGIEQVAIVNDFEALGYALPTLTPSQLRTLQPGEPEVDGVEAVIGPGTGLGQCLRVPFGDRARVVATEGGHVGFAPQNEEQQSLLRHLRGQYDHVSAERLLSGSGLVAIHHYLVRVGMTPSPAWHRASELGGDEAAAIGEAGSCGDDPTASRAVGMLLSILGAQAGTLALTVMATGGVYIAGGIAPRLLDRRGEHQLLTAFNHQGRMSAITRRVPVYLITDPAAPLYGACAALEQPQVVSDRT